jgi:serine phosphatase RsbU (regulator of sigma subunit)
MAQRSDYIKSKLAKTREPKKKIDLLNQLAWELRYTDLEESKRCTEEAFELSKENEYPRGRAYARLNLAVNHFLKSENREALEFLTRVLKYFSKNEKEKGFPVALTFAGNIYESFGDYETALEFAQKALTKAREIRYREGEGEAQSVIGLIYSRLPDFDRALTAYNESLQIRAKLRDQKAVASSLNRIGRIHALKKQYDQALENYQKSLEIREDLKQSGALPWTYLGLASTYEEMGDLENAQLYYQKNLTDECSEVDKRCRLQSILGMGRVMLRMEKMDEAHQYLDDSLTQARELRAKPLQYEVHFALANYFELTGSPEEALKHYKIYYEIREEVNNDETRNRMKNQQIAFAVEKAEKEKEIFQLRNVELKSAYDEIKLINQEITASINYASRIQAALLPQKEVLNKTLPDHFILFLPRDIVSGDFYWASQTDQKIIFCAADCTGHGVPGAFMSMLGITFLDEIVNQRNVQAVNEILNNLRKEVIKALKQTGKEQEQKDGMDIALCKYDKESGKLEFAGAYNPIYFIRNEELEEFKADRMPIGYLEDIPQSFQSQTIQIKKGDTVYLFSDGYADQFGGPDGKKYKYGTLKEFLLKIHKQPMSEQKTLLEKNFRSWKGNRDQIDDIILMGVRF